MWSRDRLLWEKKSLELQNKFNDKSRRVLIIEVKLENKILLMIMVYKANTKKEQLSTLSGLSNMLEYINDIMNNVFRGGFNMFFEDKLEEKG